jgi:GTPase SAR1 family protein
MKKKFKTPKFLEDSIKKLEKKEQEEWNTFLSTHTPVEIYFAKMQRDLFEIQEKLFSIEVMYGIKLEFTIKH